MKNLIDVIPTGLLFFSTTKGLVEIKPGNAYYLLIDASLVKRLQEALFSAISVRAQLEPKHWASLIAKLQTNILDVHDRDAIPPGL